MEQLSGVFAAAARIASANARDSRVALIWLLTCVARDRWRDTATQEEKGQAGPTHLSTRKQKNAAE